MLIHFACNHDLISHEHYLSSTLSHALGLPNTNILKLGSWSMLWNADMFPYFHSFDFYNWPCSCKTPERIFGGDHRLFGYIFTSVMQCSEKFAKKNSRSTSQTPQASACYILKFMTIQKRLNMYDLFGRVTRTKPLLCKENAAAQLGLQKCIWTNYKVSGQGHLDIRGQSGDV